MRELPITLSGVVPIVFAILVGGCASPEDGRARGGGRGGDGGNYAGKPVHAPSKIDGTKAVFREPR